MNSWNEKWFDFIQIPLNQVFSRSSVSAFNICAKALQEYAVQNCIDNNI